MNEIIEGKGRSIKPQRTMGPTAPRDGIGKEETADGDGMLWSCHVLVLLNEAGLGGVVRRVRNPPSQSSQATMGDSGNRLSTS